MTTTNEHANANAPRRLNDFMPMVQGAALIEWTGTGLFLAVSALYFVRVVGLSSAAVGAGLSIAGACAMFAAPPVARLVGRYGPRRLLVGLNLVRAAATLAYLWVHNWAEFLPVAIVVAITEQSAPSLIQAFVGARAPQELRTRIMAVQRTVLNLGISLGGLIAGLSLGAGSRSSFAWLLVGGATGYLIVAAVFAGARGDAGVDRGPARLGPLLRDRRLLLFVSFNSVMALWTPMLNLALPLWLLARTHAPVRAVGIYYAVNTVACILLQYPMNRFARTIGLAWRSYLVAAGLLGLTCIAFAFAPSLHGAGVLAAFAVAVLLLTFAELLQVGASWTLSWEFAPEDQRSAYLVLFGMGRTVGSRVAGPLLITGVVLTLGVAGWIALAVAFAVSAGYPLAAIAAERRHGDGHAAEAGAASFLPARAS